MDTCTNCGATLRPGAKFCTTCGTRLNETPVANDGWGTPRERTDEDSQQTTVLNAVQPPAEQPETPQIRESRANSTNSWTSAYESGAASTSSDDPASRFISALDRDVQTVDEEEMKTESTEDPASTWETPAPTFTPPPPSNWSYSSGDETETAAESEESGDEFSTWAAPSTWGAAQSTDEPAGEESQDVDSAGFTEDGGDEVDYLSGDENLEISSESTPELAPDEARDKAIALADELRRTIRMMSGVGESDHGAAVMALTEASLYIGDFSDVRGVLTDVKSDPRDIQTLGDLAGKADRIEALLDEHKSLADAIETAIRELNG